MRKWSLGVIVPAVVAVSALLAQQDITGAWQGTLTPPGANQGLRIVMKVSKDASGLRAAMYSIDQGGQPIAASVTQAGTSVKISVPAITGVWEGKLDSDGVNLTGMWKQGEGAPTPLNLRHPGSTMPEWPIPEPPAPLKPMAADANLVFEVASIKPSDPAAQGKLFRMPAREFGTLNTNLNDMIAWAYGLHAHQVSGGPAWMGSDKYDVVAKPEAEGKPTQAQWKVMLQKMMADRFQLKFHIEKKELQVYAIQIGKGGPKLVKSADQNANGSMLFQRLGQLPARNATMQQFAEVMQAAVLDHPVVNQTGLEGKWDFLLSWTPDESQFIQMGARVPPPSDKADAPPDIFTAFQNIGLKLVATKAPVDVMVIDRVEKPSAN